VEKIFNEIVQFDVNKLQSGGGSGIGLWVCKKIVDVHGGKVRVASEGKDRGCVFELQLPISTPHVRASRLSYLQENVHGGSHQVHPACDDSQFPAELMMQRMKEVIHRHKLSAANAVSVVHNGAVLLSADSLSGLRVLIVDDSHLNRKFINRLIGKSCRAVNEAENGVVCLEMIEAAKDEPFELILMDVCAIVIIM
jgi:hypothetical protein